MLIDLRSDFAEVYGHIRDRVAAFDVAANSGPGKPAPVRILHVGFECCQAGWIAVVFDTRPNAEPDGQWSHHIKQNAFPRPRWVEVCEAMANGPATLIQLDGTEVELAGGTALAESLGEVLRTVLLQARADGVFGPLPKAPRCELIIEHHEGEYGWPIFDDRGRENLVEP